MSKPFAFAFQFSMCICILLAYIVQTTRVHFDKGNFTKNRMSLWPYYMVMCYLVSQTTVYTFEYYEDENNSLYYAVYQSLVVLNCFWWSSIIIV